MTIKSGLKDKNCHNEYTNKWNISFIMRNKINKFLSEDIFCQGTMALWEIYINGYILFCFFEIRMC
jgi:hypothetical protein